MNTKYKIIVNPEKCIAAASCIGVAMNTFKLNEKNVVEVFNEQGDDSEMVLLAAQSCPTGTITLIDRQTEEKVWPQE